MLALFPYLKEASITPYLSKDQIAAAREMDLLTYLRRFEPEELVHIGGDTYATRTHDSLKISNGKWCWWSRNIGGTNALDYLTRVERLSFLDAVQRILGEPPRVPPKSEPIAPLPKTEFTLPPKHADNRRVFAYLRSRGIDAEIINHCIKHGQLYEDAAHHNAVSHNLIVCNRGNLLNGNGFITGVSGSGKSMAAKQEVSALALSTDHDIIIVDPEREYGELVKALGGEVITISASDPNGCHINALDLSEGYGDGREPLVMKSEFIMSLYEQLMGSDKIEPQEKSIIDRSVGNIYREYLKSYQGQPPTLKDLYDDLMKQVNPEAHRIALALELFTVGSLNVFSHQTNINTKSRILCFDIQDLGENLKSVGLLVMLDAIYNRVIQNRKTGKYTHVYIDEIYLFFANGNGSGHGINNYSSEFLYKCWKRFRKYGATLTGITQNVEECLLSNTARMMFANSEFLLMLNQATTDREQLARLLGASDTQMSYVDNAPAGHGLIKVGGAIVPFTNELPKNTELYRLMSTRPGED